MLTLLGDLIRWWAHVVGLTAVVLVVLVASIVLVAAGCEFGDWLRRRRRD